MWQPALEPDAKDNPENQDRDGQRGRYANVRRHVADQDRGSAHRG
jgi:hypothetical protein